jgi:glycosidase
MNYRWYRPTRQFFNDAPESMPVSAFVAELKDKMTGISTDRQQAMMNLVASHDAPRIATDLYNKNPYKYKAKPGDDHNYKIDKPDAQTRKIQEMLLIFQYTYIGAPHIWYGDEIGMWGADDPDTRKPMIWPDLKYEDETCAPFEVPRKKDKVEQDKQLLEYYKKLIRIRKSNPALVYGDITFSVVNDNNRILAFNRNFESKEVVVVINKSDKKQIVKIPVNKEGNYHNAFEPTQILKSEKGFLDIEVEGTKALIYILE